MVADWERQHGVLPSLVDLPALQQLASATAEAEGVADGVFASAMLEQWLAGAAGELPPVNAVSWPFLCELDPCLKRCQDIACDAEVVAEVHGNLVKTLKHSLHAIECMIELGVNCAVLCRFWGA